MSRTLVNNLVASLDYAPPRLSPHTRQSVALLLAALYLEVDDAPPCAQSPQALVFEAEDGSAELCWTIQDFPSPAPMGMAMTTHVRARVQNGLYHVVWQRGSLCGTHGTTTLAACADFVREVLQDRSGLRERDGRPAPFKKFKLAYTDKATQERRLETPRLMITVDGKHKSLFVNDGTVLATVPITDSDAELWNKARMNVAIVV